MILKEALQQTQRLVLPAVPLEVEQTCHREMLQKMAGIRSVDFSNEISTKKGTLYLVAADPERKLPAKWKQYFADGKAGCYIQIRPDGGGEIIASHPAFLYAFVTKMLEDEPWLSSPIEHFENGRMFETAFKWHRPLFDYLLTQSWRTARRFDPESHIREMARAGYTHFEVNSLAQPVPFEDPVPGEYYSQFYTYCAALDQFVDSELNRGIYPLEYLTANLNLLKRYAALGKKYGLQPGILCFEPRSVPEAFFQRYPTLRGARVDHPFRSRRPRYTITTAHPLGREHYRQLMQNLLREVPELAYMSIWSNDSGAGFEYTCSLYVGRNGGPYLIREWRSHEHIAEAAGKNVVRFLKLLRDAAAEINPEFRVSLRLEPFKEEHDIIVAELEPGLDVEVPSMLVRGYELPYHHDKYKDVGNIAGSIFHIRFDEKEQTQLQHFQQRNIRPHLIYSHGNGYNLEPLLGIPFPWLLWKKLNALYKTGFEFVANLGGFTPSSLAPYHINQEVFREFQLNPEVDVDEVVEAKAGDWADNHRGELVELWRLSNEVIEWMPPLPLYSHFGFVWLRTWVRPIIPDLHAIPEKERRYYEAFMVSSANNPNLVDLGRDVLFELISMEYGEHYVERVDRNVLPRLEKAIERADELVDELKRYRAARVFTDLRDRLRALKCWTVTQRSTAAWVAGVYGYLKSESQKERQRWREYLDHMIDMEIQNARELLALWRTSTTQFMVVSKSGETSFIYGENFGELLERKIELMEKYRHVEPRIDQEIMWKI